MSYDDKLNSYSVRKLDEACRAIVEVIMAKHLDLVTTKNVQHIVESDVENPVSDTAWLFIPVRNHIEDIRVNSNI
jgi:hypothetical protein